MCIHHLWISTKRKVKDANSSIFVSFFKNFILKHPSPFADSRAGKLLAAEQVLFAGFAVNTGGRFAELSRGPVLRHGASVATLPASAAFMSTASRRSTVEYFCVNKHSLSLIFYTIIHHRQDNQSVFQSSSCLTCLDIWRFMTHIFT